MFLHLLIINLPSSSLNPIFFFNKSHYFACWSVGCEFLFTSCRLHGLFLSLSSHAATQLLRAQDRSGQEHLSAPVLRGAGLTQHLSLCRSRPAPPCTDTSGRGGWLCDVAPRHIIVQTWLELRRRPPSPVTPRAGICSTQHIYSSFPSPSADACASASF